MRLWTQMRSVMKVLAVIALFTIPVQPTLCQLGKAKITQPWEQYLQAGEQYHAKHDEVNAKRYWLAALSLVEKSGAQGQGSASILGRLRGDLLKLYPMLPAKEGEVTAQRVQEQQEKVALLNRYLQYDDAHYPAFRRKDQSHILVFEKYSLANETKELEREKQILSASEKAKTAASTNSTSENKDASTTSASSSNQAASSSGSCQ